MNISFPLSAAGQAACPAMDPLQGKENSSPPDISLLASKVAELNLSPSLGVSDARTLALFQKIAQLDCSTSINPAVITSVIESLDDYTSADHTFSGSIQAFLTKNIPLFFPDNPQVSWTLIQAGGTKGVSGAGVLVVRDTTRVLAIVKGFLRCEELVQEIRAQSMLERLALSKSTFPVALQVGKCMTDRPLYLMLQNVAKGEGLDDIIEFALSTPPLSVERNRAIIHIKQALQETALALAELHSRSITPRADHGGVQLMAHDFLKNFSLLRKEMLSPFLQDVVFDRPLKSVPDSKRFLVDFVNDTVSAFMSDPGPGAIIHGDAHQGNFFYDKSTNTVTCIDLPTMSRSFDATHQGLMTPEWDVQLFAHKIADVAKVGTGLTIEEVGSLKKHFKKTYRMTTHHIQKSQAAQRFCKLDRIITTLVQRLQELKEYPSDDDPKKQVIEKIVVDRKCALKKMMIKYTNVQPLQSIPEHTGPIPKIRKLQITQRK